MDARKEFESKFLHSGIQTERRRQKDLGWSNKEQLDQVQSLEVLGDESIYDVVLLGLLRF